MKDFFLLFCLGMAETKNKCSKGHAVTAVYMIVWGNFSILDDSGAPLKCPAVHDYKCQP